MNYFNPKVEGRRKDIQGLRAIAVAAVVAFHAGLPIPGGFTGVDVFFVISGYVITNMLVGEWARTGTLDLKRFYIRRFKRLTPALALLVSFTLLVSLFVHSPLGEELRVTVLTGISAVFMAANVVIATKTGGYFDVSAEGNPLLNTWSLAIEEQFYLFFPIILFFSFLQSRHNKRFKMTALFAIVGVGIASLVAASIGAFTPNISEKWSLILGFYSPISRAWEFAAGAVLALVPKNYSASRSASNIFYTVGVILVCVGFFAVDGETLWPGPLTLLPVIGTVLLILAGSTQANTIWGKSLSAKPMVFIGDISYSWYLWHWPAIVFASFLVNSHWITLSAAAIVSLVPSIVSFRWIENPLRHISVTSLNRGIAFVVLVLALPVSSSLFVQFANERNLWSSTIHQFKDFMDPKHASEEAGCGGGFVPKDPDGSSCFWNKGASGRPIYLIGDSNADHSSEAVINVGLKLQRPVQILTKGGCSLIGRSWSHQTDAEANRCLNYVEGTISLLGRSKPGLVILGMSDSIWRELGKVAVGPSRGEESTDKVINRTYLLNDLVSKVLEVKRGGHDVLLLLPVPKFMTLTGTVLFDPAKCTTISVLSHSCPKKVVTSTEYQDSFQSDAREAIIAAGSITHSNVLDLRSHFCPGNRCSNFSDSEVLYKDAGHLTVKASEGMTELFYEEIKKSDHKIGIL